MGVVLLCILPDGEQPGTELAAGPRGPVRGHSVAGLTLWVRPTPHPPTASLEEVRAHHRIVADAWERRPAVLPVRFGQWFASVDDLERATAPEAERYRRALERARGAAEFSVRLVDPATGLPGEEAPTRSGTEYLRAAAARGRARAEAVRRGERVAAELAEALAGLLLGERVDPAPEGPALVTIAHLVRRPDEARYAEAVGRFAAARPELRFLRTGPWPVWSFTS